MPLPSLAVAVMVAVPLDTAVTLPFWSTVATEVFVELHVTLLSLAVLGVMVAVSVSLPPSFKLSDVLFNVTTVTYCFTVTEQVAFLPLPSLAVAVIVAVPTAFAVTTPEEDTVAMDVFELLQVMLLSSAVSGKIVAVSVSVSPV